MLPRATFSAPDRLSGPKHFASVFQSPIYRAGGQLLVVASRNGIAGARLGTVVPKRQVRKAVDRNRIKRLVRESFRRHKHVLGNLDVIVVARAVCVGLRNKAITTALDQHWRRLQRCNRSCSP